MRSEAVTLKILSSNTLNPEIIEINPPTINTVLVLTDSFFTNLVCHESLDGLYTGKIPDVSKLDAYMEQLNWWSQCEYKYMKIKAKVSIWAEKELFGRFSTFISDLS
jgi:hypothetical protein